MDATGRFVVTWINSTATRRDVEMRDFSAEGTALTGIVPVNSNVVDYHPDVAASNGSFVITWSQRYSDSDFDIYAERFVISGGVPSPKGIFGVNADTAFEDFPSIAMSPSGAFDIAYQLKSSSGNNDIRMHQYNSSGVFLRGVTVNGDGFDELHPDVAMDDAGNAVVAYQRFIGGDWGVYANRVTSGGSVSSMISQDYGGTNETDPSVALAPTGGRFVVAYTVDSHRVQVAEMSSTNTVLAVQCPNDTVDYAAVNQHRRL